MRHFASPAFCQAYAKLPDNVRALADESGHDLIPFWIGSYADYNALIK
jgi:hypothetical protein